MTLMVHRLFPLGAASAALLLAGCFPSNYDRIKTGSGQPQAQVPARKPAELQGQLLTVEAQSVTVQAREGLYAVARRTGASVEDLIAANKLDPPYGLKRGQVLRIPAMRYHVVGPGDTVSVIAQRYGTSTRMMVATNNLDSPNRIRVGQKLRLPGYGEAQQIASAEAAQTRSSSAAAANAPTPAQVRAAARFAWPLEGRLLSSYGPKAGGRHNDGINIVANTGDTVRAAADGVVAYASDELESFGWLVLVNHGDGWVTAYGHNSELLVKRGDQVRQGEPLARAGASGDVDRPQLHFQVRRGREAINPISVLPRRELSAARAIAATPGG